MKIVSEKMKYEEPRIEVVNLDLGEGVCQASTEGGASVIGWPGDNAHHQHINIEDGDNIDERWGSF